MNHSDRSYWSRLSTGQRDDSTLRWSRECLVANRVPGTAKKIRFGLISLDLLRSKIVTPGCFRLFLEGDEELPHLIWVYFMSHCEIPILFLSTRISWNATNGFLLAWFDFSSFGGLFLLLSFNPMNINKPFKTQVYNPICGYD